MGYRSLGAVIALSTASLFHPQLALAQQAPTASIAEMASTPLVRVNIAESLRTPPDEASMTVGTQAKASTATEAVAANKVKTEKLLAAIARYQDTVQDAARQHAPQRFAAYASSLAAAFNEYYRDHRVLECEDPAQQRLRLATVEAARQAMQAAWTAMGIPVLASM